MVDSASVKPVEDEESEELMFPAEHLDQMGGTGAAQGDEDEWEDIPEGDEAEAVEESENPWPSLPLVGGEVMDLEDEDADDFEAETPAHQVEGYDGSALQAEDLAREWEYDSDSEAGDLPDPDNLPNMSSEINEPGPEPEPEKKIEGEEQSLFFWRGWLANKFRFRYPDLGLGSHGPLPETAPERIPLWTGVFSCGGQRVASDSFLERLQLWESAFERIHGATLCYEKGVIRRTCAAVSAIDPEAPKDLVRTFARTRMFLRIRVLNLNRKRKKAAEKADRAAEKVTKAAARAEKEVAKAAAKAEKQAAKAAAKAGKEAAKAAAKAEKEAAKAAAKAQKEAAKVAEKAAKAAEKAAGATPRNKRKAKEY